MKWVVSDYYPSFRCTADRCRHSCCTADWEIDIDADTYRLYSTVEGDLGRRLRDGIDHAAAPPHFRFTADKRCPLLNENGLCDLITALGEGALCQICRDHPRFRNFFSDRVEVGVGLCCEEACRLVLENTDTVRLITIDDDGGTEALTEEEAAFLTWRDEIFTVLQDRSKPFWERAAALSVTQRMPKIPLSPPQTIDFYRSLERLDPEWDRYLDRRAAREGSRHNSDVPDTAWEQLAVYLVLRHTADGLDDGRLRERLTFCLHATSFIYDMCIALNADFDEMQNICRLYSGEIEYSDDNMEALLALFS